MSQLYLNIEFTPENSETPFVFTSNVQPDKRHDILDTIIRDQPGQGADHNPRAERDTYTIKITWDLSDDSYKVSSNTGNKGLTAGILMLALQYI